MCCVALCCDSVTVHCVLCCVSVTVHCVLCCVVLWQCNCALCVVLCCVVLWCDSVTVHCVLCCVVLCCDSVTVLQALTRLTSYIRSVLWKIWKVVLLLMLSWRFAPARTEGKASPVSVNWPLPKHYSFHATLNKALRTVLPGRLIREVSGPHTPTHHSRWYASGRGIGPSQRPVPGNTQHSQETDTRVSSGIRTSSPSKW